MKNTKINMTTSENGFRSMVRGNYQGACQLYEEAVAGNSGNYIAFYELGWNYLLLHQYEHAENAFDEVLKKYPHVSIYYDLARVCCLQRKYKKAQSALEKALSLSPDNVIFLYQLARLYTIQGYSDKAQEVFAKIEKIAPQIVGQENEQFYDSLVQLEPIQLDGGQADMTFIDPAISPSGPVFSDVTMVDGIVAEPEVKKVDTDLDEEPEITIEEAVFDDFLYKEKLLGQGGMGEVFLVRHLEWDKRVAIKRGIQTGNTVIMERFQDECLTWLLLEKHPNIVSAVHFTKWENKPSLLIEYIDGKDLKYVIKQIRIRSMIDTMLNKLGNCPPLDKALSLLTFFGGTEERNEIAKAWMIIYKEHSPLPLEEFKNILQDVRAFQQYEVEVLLSDWTTLPSVNSLHKISILDILDYSIQIARGMAHAHKHGMLHRDLKPANILIEPESNGPGILKVTDFGLAKMKEKEGGAKISLTSSVASLSELAGTPRYMAPEQWENISSEKTDIFSFGMIIYEMFSQGYSPYSSHINDDTKTGFWWNTIAKQNEFYYWSTRHCSETPRNLNEYNNSIPEKLNALVLMCLQKDSTQRPESFLKISEELIHIYNEIAGKSYHRTEDLSPDLMAIELNNRAISLLEMNYFDQANQFLEKALKISPNLIEIQINHALIELFSEHISVEEFISKTINYFDNSERDIEVLNILIGIYFRHGYSYPSFLKKISELEKKFPRNYRLQRIKAKYLYLIGNYNVAEKSLRKLCSLENSRIEDWYHLIGLLHHSQKEDELWSTLEKSPYHFKQHYSYKIIRDIITHKIHPSKPDYANSWYEMGRLNKSYPDMEIVKLVSTQDGKNLVLYYTNKEKNLYQIYNLDNWKSKVFALSIGNIIKKDHIHAVGEDSIATLALDGNIHIQKVKEQKKITIKSNFPASSYQAETAFLKLSSPYLIAIYHFQDANGEYFSYIAFFREDNLGQMIDVMMKGQILGVTSHNNGNNVWLFDENNLYTWSMQKEIPPQAQKYGGEKITPQTTEKTYLFGIYYTSDSNLVAIKQNIFFDVSGNIVDGYLTIYLWNLDDAKKHKSSKINDFIIKSSQFAKNTEKFIFLGREKTEQHKLLLWDIKGWKTEQEQVLTQKCNDIELTENEQFIFVKADHSLLAFDNFQYSAKVEVVYFTTNLMKADRFNNIKNINQIASTQTNKFVFVLSAQEKIFIWKSIVQEPFPVQHKLGYLYMRPTTTSQDITLQKRIQRLLLESDKALQENNPQWALDYLRGIQNFKGYDWELVINKIYAMAQKFQWKKIGLREALKLKRIAWESNEIVLSPGGEYILPTKFTQNQLPQILRVSNFKEVSLEDVIGVKGAKGRWLASKDGAFLLFQEGKTLTIYDLKNKKIRCSISVNIQIQEAIASKNGSTLLLKQEGFGNIAIVDLEDSKVIDTISESKYHTIQDCCTLVDDGKKILFASECQGGFQWELLKKENTWSAKILSFDFTEAHMYKNNIGSEESENTLIANRSYVIFRGVNFDFLSDSQFKHIEIFELHHEVFFSLKEKKFRKIWIEARAITTTSDGFYTFLSIDKGDIAVWRTAGHINNWKQITILHEHQNSVSSLRVTGDDKFLITGDVAGQIKILKIDKIKAEIGKDKWEVVNILKADNTVTKLQLSDNDQYLFASCLENLHIWQIDWIWDIEQYVE